MDANTPTQEVILSWSAPIAPRHERGKVWYIAAGIVIALCVTYGIYADSLPFAVVAVLIGVMYILLRKHVPADVPCSISQRGITIGKRTVLWEQAQGFWLLRTPAYTELHVVPAGRGTEMIIQTGDQDISALQGLLLQYTSELTDRRETLIDTIIRICKL